MGQSDHHKIGKRAGIVSFFTFISRILGLVRDAVVAYFLGATATADAFYVAFRIPNLIRRLTAEGALTIAFVPVFTDYLRKSKKDALVVVSVVFTYLSLALVCITLFGVLFAPYLVKLIAYGFQHSQDKFDLTIYLTRLMFPYIFLISLTALAMGILNSLKHFASPAASPILLNVFIIIGAAFFSRWFDEPTLGLAVGVLVGGCAQLTLQIPALYKRGMLPRFNFNYKHPALKSLLFLMIPAAFGAAVYQVNVLIITLLASFLPDGSVSYLWYADRVTEFPLGVFAIAIATATLPTLSDHASAKDLGSFKKTFSHSLRAAFAITIPSAIGLYILASPVIRLLFQRGEFSSFSTTGTAGALMFFVIGLPFVAGVRNVVPAFFAMKDSKTPVAIATVTVICNSLLALVLMRPMLHKGLALAISIADIINFTLLIIFLRRKIGALGMRTIFLSVARIIFAAVLMGLAVFVFKTYLVPSLFEKGWLELAAGVFASITIGVVIYIVILRLIKSPEYEVVATVLRKLKGK
jgi:putative peptidoglycan lipid II flippase